VVTEPSWLGGEFEAGQVRGSGLAERGPGQPVVNADDVDRGGGEDVAEVGLGESGVPGAADAGAADGLRDGGLDACSDVVPLLPLFGLLFLSAPVENFLLLAGQQRQAATVAALLGGPRAG
jgi:hypothetical protein